MEESLIALAANFGFPALIALYVLMRIEPLIRELQKTVLCLTAVVAKQQDITIHEIQQIFNSGKI